MDLLLGVEHRTVGYSWTTNHNKVAVPGLVSEPITAYVGHLNWQLLVATLAVANSTPVLLQQATADKIGNQRIFDSSEYLSVKEYLILVSACIHTGFEHLMVMSK